MQNQVNEKAQQCLGCKIPQCENGCPVKNHIRDFIAKVKEGHPEEASAILYAVNPYPEFTSLLCDHQRQCQGHCVKRRLGEPVAIPLIENYLSTFPKPFKKGKPNGRKVALIGGGIANMAAATVLLNDGYEVEIYERENALGGAIFTGIPSYRFDKSILSKAQDDLIELGATLHLGVEVGDELHLDEIMGRNDRIIVSVGAEVPNSAGIEIRPGIENGLTLLHNLNVKKDGPLYSKKYKKAVVWGGGNVAMDCARSLIRLMPKVDVVYRRGREQAPANGKEIDEALKEGVAFDFLTNVKEAKYDSTGSLKSLICIKMELGEKDESGRASFHEIPGSDFEMECDFLAIAIGDKPVKALDGHSIQPIDGHRTENPKIYVSGDAFLGASTVSACIGDGVKAAREIESSFGD